MFRIFLYFQVLFLVVLAAGCAPKQEVVRRYFWPPLSDEPKIEYVGFVQSDYDVKRKQIGVVEETILGRERPQVLFEHPFDVCSWQPGLFYVSEPSAKRVHVVDMKNVFIGELQTEKGEPFPFELPLGVDCDRHGNVYVVDSHMNKVFVFGGDGRKKEVWGGAHFRRPVNLAIDDARGLAYVVDPGRHMVLQLSLADGGLIREVGARGVAPGFFNFPLDVDVDPDGNLYVLDSLNARVQVFSSDGNLLRYFGERGTALGSFQRPKGLAVGPYGHVYVTDSMAHRFVVFNQEGHYMITVGGQFLKGGGVVPGGFNLPQGIDVGPQGEVLIVDSLSRVLHRYQYLSDEYLLQNPVLPGQAVNPFEKSLGSGRN